MRTLRALTGLIAIFAVGSYLWGHHLLGATLALIVFPLVILDDFIVEKRKTHTK
jgi:hypothetical protein